MLQVVEWIAVTLAFAGAGLVTSLGRRKRMVGFVCYLAANALWIGWAMYMGVFSQITMYAGFSALAIIGVWRNARKRVD